jgi:copper chaperone CopZ
VSTITETIQVSGVRCERCVNRLAAALTGLDGLEAANANLLGQVTLAWDDTVTTREAVLEAMSRAGFHELQSV